MKCKIKRQQFTKETKASIVVTVHNQSSLLALTKNSITQCNLLLILISNFRIFEQNRNMIDRTNFKKPNIFLAYVNAMFNGGVFANPNQD
jgi:hypothetical protein